MEIVHPIFVVVNMVGVVILKDIVLLPMDVNRVMVSVLKIILLPYRLFNQ